MQEKEAISLLANAQEAQRAGNRQQARALRKRAKAALRRNSRRNSY